MVFGRDFDRELIEGDLLQTLISAAHDSEKVPISEVKSWGGRSSDDQALIDRIIDDWCQKDVPVQRVQDEKGRDCLRVTDIDEANDHIDKLKDGTWPY